MSCEYSSYKRNQVAELTMELSDAVSIIAASVHLGHEKREQSFIQSYQSIILLFTCDPLPFIFCLFPVLHCLPLDHKAKTYLRERTVGSTVSVLPANVIYRKAWRKMLMWWKTYRTRLFSVPLSSPYNFPVVVISTSDLNGNWVVYRH